MSKNKYLWALPAGIFLAAGLILRFPVHRFGYLPYALAAVGLLIVFWHFRKNWAALSGMLTAAALVLRFAVRGYAYWGYAALFLAALIAAHRFLSKTLWRILLVLVGIGLVYFCIVETPIIKNARTDSQPERKYLVVLGAAVPISLVQLVADAKFFHIYPGISHQRSQGDGLVLLVERDQHHYIGVASVLRGCVTDIFTYQQHIGT